MKIKTSILIVMALILSASAWAQQDANFLTYDDHGKRDPLWPLVTSSGVITSYETDLYVSDMVLEGIITGTNGRNMAIINGNIIQKDDVIGTYRVAEIGDNYIVLFQGQERFELKLKKED
jgi:hypothetical protein